MKKKKMEYLLATVALGGMLCLSGCSEKKPEPVSQDTVVSDVQPEDTAAQDETTMQGETTVQDETTADSTAWDDMEPETDIQETDPEEEAVQKVYEPIQRIEGDYTVAEDDGEVHTSYSYTYDSDLDLVRMSKLVTHPDGEVVETEETYEYLRDLDGNKVKGFNMLAYESIDDNMGVHKEESLPIIYSRSNIRNSSERTEYKSEYEYNTENRLAGIRTEDGSISVEHQGNTIVYHEVRGGSACNKWVYDFDDIGQLVRYEENYKLDSGWKNANGVPIEQKVYEYAYDDSGRRISDLYYNVCNGAKENEIKTVWEYEYDERNRPVVSKEYITYAEDDLENELCKTIIITYDADGKVTEENFNWKSDWKSYELTREFFYNTDGKLESVTVDGEKEWELTYDDSLLSAVSHYDITKNPSIKEILPYNTNGIEGERFVEKYIRDYIGVEFSSDLGDWEITYGNNPDLSVQTTDAYD